MIDSGDRILVGLSGGKDSWALLWFLLERRKRAPIDFSLVPVYIDPGFDNGPAQVVADFTHRMGCPARIEQTDYGLIAHSEINRENPCFLCSRLRRKRLFEIAAESGCNKIALGHNKDDLIETFFINMFYAGEMSTMMPCQPFFGGRLMVIRPLAYADESSLIRFAAEMKWPVAENPCPSAGQTKRADIKSMLQGFYHANRKIKGNIFRAMRHVKPEYLLR
jgi:tRNA 2-thiocytidine biosynthesis protein TtcA